MPRANGNDLCELFGYTPDDTSSVARKQWKSQLCPFVGSTCIKHSHQQDNGSVLVYGSCSVVNKSKSGATEEVIICPQRLYADGYKALHACIRDATGRDFHIYLPKEYSEAKKRKELPKEFFVLFGRNCGKEISLSNPGVIDFSLDWVLAGMFSGVLEIIIPCEVQSIDITGNYRATWNAYSKESAAVPNSSHGMNWANVWKRLIPQLILKSSIASTSRLCKYGIYFVVPDRVYLQFEKLVGHVPNLPSAADKTLSIMTYGLGPNVPEGQIRQLHHSRTVHMLSTEFAKSFASGSQLPLGTQLDEKVKLYMESL